MRANFNRDLLAPGDSPYGQSAGGRLGLVPVLGGKHQEFSSTRDLQGHDQRGWFQGSWLRELDLRSGCCALRVQAMTPSLFSIFKSLIQSIKRNLYPAYVYDNYLNNIQV